MKRLDKLGLNADLLQDEEMKMVVGGGDSDSFSYDWGACMAYCEGSRNGIQVATCDANPCGGRGVVDCYCPW